MDVQYDVVLSYACKTAIIFGQNKCIELMSLMYTLRKTVFIMLLNGKSESFNIYFIWYIVLWGPIPEGERFLTALFPMKIYYLVIRIQILGKENTAMFFCGLFCV